MGTSTPLSILPGGTANIMSVELGIPRDLAGAVRLACRPQPHVRSVDLGRSGDSYFIQRIGIGLDADKVNRATRELKERLGVLAYSLSWLRAVHESPRATYRLLLDGKEVECDGVTCHVANSGSIGVRGLVLLRDISVSDGLLDVLVVRDAGIGSALSIAGVAAGHPVNPEAFHHWQVREVGVEADIPQQVHADGEICGSTPISIQVVPAAVKIIAPDGAPRRPEAPGRE
jgi:YegS/Rv2252/BmrU family lipid kinase